MYVIARKFCVIVLISDYSCKLGALFSLYVYFESRWIQLTAFTVPISLSWQLSLCRSVCVCSCMLFVHVVQRTHLVSFHVECDLQKYTARLQWWYVGCFCVFCKTSCVSFDSSLYVRAYLVMSSTHYFGFANTVLLINSQWVCETPVCFLQALHTVGRRVTSSLDDGSAGEQPRCCRHRIGNRRRQQ